MKAKFLVFKKMSAIKIAQVVCIKLEISVM